MFASLKSQDKKDRWLIRSEQGRIYVPSSSLIYSTHIKKFKFPLKEEVKDVYSVVQLLHAALPTIPRKYIVEQPWP